MDVQNLNARGYEAMEIWLTMAICLILLLQNTLTRHSILKMSTIFYHGNSAIGLLYMPAWKLRDWRNINGCSELKCEGVWGYGNMTEYGYLLDSTLTKHINKTFNIRNVNNLLSW